MSNNENHCAKNAPISWTRFPPGESRAPIQPKRYASFLCVKRRACRPNRAKRLRPAASNWNKKHGAEQRVSETDFFLHPTAIVDAGATVGRGTKIWHFSHVLGGSFIGEGW